LGFFFLISASRAESELRICKSLDSMKELKELDYFKAWLIFFAVATIGGGLVGLILGSFLAAFLGAAGATMQEMTNANRILGFIVALPISYVAFRAVVGKFLFPKLWEDGGSKEV
jgi:hypothetical protein